MSIIHFVRATARFTTLSVLSGIYDLTGRADEALQKNVVQFLLFHGIPQDMRSQLRAVLADLSEHYSFISYSEAVERIWSGSIDGRYAALSFDDGLKTCVDAAAILNEMQMKACFFIYPAVIQEKGSAAQIDVSNTLYSNSNEQFMSWCDLENLMRSGHEIGSHTLSHPDLNELSGDQIQYEMEASLRLLSERLGRIRHFAWPYGRFKNFNRVALDLVFKSGYESCASGERGCHAFACDPKKLCVRRDNIVPSWPASHIRYFLARNSLTASELTNGFP